MIDDCWCWKCGIDELLLPEFSLPTLACIEFVDIFDGVWLEFEDILKQTDLSVLVLIKQREREREKINKIFVQ